MLCKYMASVADSKFEPCGKMAAIMYAFLRSALQTSHVCLQGRRTSFPYLQPACVRGSLLRGTCIKILLTPARSTCRYHHQLHLRIRAGSHFKSAADQSVWLCGELFGQRFRYRCQYLIFMGYLSLCKCPLQVPAFAGLMPLLLSQSAAPGSWRSAFVMQHVPNISQAVHCSMQFRMPGVD